MLDGLLGRGFASKCKSLIKQTKSRVEVIRRKRNATLKFLKKDIADLLSNGLEINAFSRADGLLAEIMLSACYDFVENSCDFVLKHLSVLQRIKHCPEDCREAVSSLMFAAARFSDLPELRELRQTFYERYGNSVELFVNQKFVENLNSRSFSMEKKMWLMQDIASEFSIKWDSRACEQRMASQNAPTPRVGVAVQDQPKTHGSHVDVARHKLNGRENVPKADKSCGSSKGRVYNTDDRYRFLNDEESTLLKRNQADALPVEIPKSGYKSFPVKEENMVKTDKRDILHHGRQETTFGKLETQREETPLEILRTGDSSQRKRIESVGVRSNIHDDSANAVLNKDDRVILTPGKSHMHHSDTRFGLKNDGKDALAGKSNFGQHDFGNSVRSGHEDEANKSKPSYGNLITPPYTKPSTKPKGRINGVNLGSSNSGFKHNVVPGIPEDASGGRVYAPNTGEEQESNDQESELCSIGRTRTSHRDRGTDFYYKDDDNLIPIPKPRSSRRRHAKSLSGQDDINNSEEPGVKRKSRSKRRDDSKKGLQILFDDDRRQTDEEERIIDRLLIHYSKKPSNNELTKVRGKSKNHHTHGQEFERGNSSNPSETPDVVVHQPRSVSLPREQTSSEPKKVYARATSFQPDRSSPARHVHPKLPDYDDLAARFAAMKGR